MASADGWFVRGYKSLTFGLAHRLALIFGSLLSLFVAIAIVVNVNIELDLVRQRLTEKATHLGMLIADLTASNLDAMRLSELESVYHDLKRQPYVDYVYVVDDAATVLVAGGGRSAEDLDIIDTGLVEGARANGRMQRTRSGDIEHIAIPVRMGTRHLGTLRFGIPLGAYDRDLRVVWLRNLIVGPLIVLLGMVLIVLIARRLTEPLDVLIASTDRAAQGELDQFIELDSNDELGQLARSFNVMLDALRKSIDEVHELAYRDKLTALPNRAWFHEHLKRMISDGKRRGEHAAVLFLDLDRFKHVNDTLGHDAGDQLLAAFAERLRNCVRDSDGIALLRAYPEEDGPAANKPPAAVARLGGDEFTIMLPHLSKCEDAAIVAERIIGSLADPFELGGEVTFVGTSIGIACFPKDGDMPEDLLKHADTAMYQAKHAGRSTYRFYDAGIAEMALQRVSLERDLRRAIEENQFRLFLQPLFSVSTGEFVGAEALVRWQHPREGLLTPDRFLSIAEEARLMPELGRMTIRNALQSTHAWPTVRGRTLHLAVNISMEELETDDFGEWMLGQIADAGFDPHDLVIEVTEGTIMGDSACIDRQVALLRANGVRFAVDDFGVGYSNLARLRRLAFETLKIDQSLMHGVGHDRDIEILVTSILKMASALDLDVVAEGIETREQWTFLQRNRCGFAQGYFLTKPMPHETFPAWARREVSIAPVMAAE